MRCGISEKDIVVIETEGAIAGKTCFLLSGKTISEGAKAKLSADYVVLTIPPGESPAFTMLISHIQIQSKHKELSAARLNSKADNFVC